MKDGIIKGNGNSRYLKSVADFLTQYPTYEAFAAALTAGTLPVDLNGINEDGWQQIGDALCTETLLRDFAADKYGMDHGVVPTTILELLSKSVLIDADKQLSRRCGTKWFEEDLPASFNEPLVVSGENQFLIIPKNQTRCYYSKNGIDWETGGTIQARAWNAAGYGAGKFIAVCKTGDNQTVIAVSEDGGLTWNEYTALIGSDWKSVAYGGGRFVVVGSTLGSTAMYSDDGVTWQSAALPVTGNWCSVAYGNGKFIATNTGNTQYGAVSEDGITWGQIDFGTTDVWSFVTYGDGMFCIVSSSRYKWSINNGDSWTLAATPQSSTAKIVYAGYYWLLISGSTGSIYYATSATLKSGSGWSATGVSGNYADLIYGFGTALVMLSGSSATVLRTSDKNEWTGRLTNVLGDELAKLPFPNAVLVYGTYTGTNTYGSSSPRKINTTARPVAIIVVGPIQSSSGTDGYSRMVAIAGVTSAALDYNGGISANTATFGAKSVSWYGSSANLQLNQSGKKYAYLVICIVGGD